MLAISILDTLVYDRTQADADAKNHKGSYNHADLNRVGEVVAYIRDMFLAYGYRITASPRLGWTEADIPRRSDMDLYLRNIRSLGGLIVFDKNPPVLPMQMDGLTWQTANNIERFLSLLGVAAEQIPASWVELGQAESGATYEG